MSPHFMGGDIIYELMRMAEAMRREGTATCHNCTNANDLADGAKVVACHVSCVLHHPEHMGVPRAQRLNVLHKEHVLEHQRSCAICEDNTGTWPR